MGKQPIIKIKKVCSFNYDWCICWQMVEIDILDMDSIFLVNWKTSFFRPYACAFANTCTLLVEKISSRSLDVRLLLKCTRERKCPIKNHYPLSLCPFAFTKKRDEGILKHWPFFRFQWKILFRLCRMWQMSHLTIKGK